MFADTHVNSWRFNLENAGVCHSLFPSPTMYIDIINNYLEILPHLSLNNTTVYQHISLVCFLSSSEKFQLNTCAKNAFDFCQAGETEI